MMDRRSFLRLSGAGLSSVVLSSTVPSLAQGAGTRLAMLYDASRCVGCRACQISCKRWNELPPESTDPQGLYENPSDLSAHTWTLIKLIEHEKAGGFQWLFLNEGCFHCTQAACVDVCPTKALKHHPLGMVTFERELCNGCGYCTQACPFGIPQLDKTGFTWEWKASKCTFCQDRTTNGLQPACVESCPTGALSWGDRDELIRTGKERVEVLKTERDSPNANLYGDVEMGGLGRLYVLTERPSIYGLQEEPHYPTLVTLWQEIIQPVGGIAVVAAAVGAFLAFLVGRTHIRMEEVE
jgi:formate dehydrogenase iron-sulfur subunit